jgi:hypothetical protein
MVKEVLLKIFLDAVILVIDFHVYIEAGIHIKACGVVDVRSLLPP